MKFNQNNANCAELVAHSGPGNVGVSPETRVFDNLKVLLSYEEAAQYLGISESYLRRLKRQGQVSFVPIGHRSIRFSIHSLNRWINEREIR